MSFFQTFTQRTFAVLVFVLLSACSEATQQKALAENVIQTEQAPLLQVYKRASCGCCKKWVDHIEEQGFSSSVHNHNSLSAFKIEQGIKARYHSCHTAISEQGYVFEGHVPAKYIKRFLNESHENVLGLAVPAMPVGSPGMEVDEQFMPYQILLLKADGSSEVYAKVNSYREQF